jgi:RNA-binding protein Nova
MHQQDDHDVAANSTKRATIPGGQDANLSEEGREPLFFKLLCPQGITGLIIGKGGANIIQLNATTGARIKLSQNNEYFPNTTDRILLSKLLYPFVSFF